MRDTHEIENELKEKRLQSIEKQQSKEFAQYLETDSIQDDDTAVMPSDPYHAQK